MKTSIKMKFRHYLLAGAFLFLMASCHSPNEDDTTFTPEEEEETIFTPEESKYVLSDEQIADLGICPDDAKKKLSHAPTGIVYVETETLPVKIDFNLKNKSPDFFDFTLGIVTVAGMEIDGCPPYTDDCPADRKVFEGTLYDVPNLGFLVYMYKEYREKLIDWTSGSNYYVSNERNGNFVFPKLHYALAQECLRDNICSQTRKAVLQMVLDKRIVKNGVLRSMSTTKTALFLMSVILIKENYADFIAAVQDNPDLQKVTTLSVYIPDSAYLLDDLGVLVTQFAEIFLNDN